MKKYYLIFLSLLFIFPISVFAEAEKSNELISNAVSGLLMEQSTGEILFEKDKDKQVPVASMTKMVAQTIILERIESGKIKWDDIVEVSKNAADMGGSQIYLTAGEKMSVRDLFKGISMASGNDATVAMAEYIAGDEASFVKLMNKKVKELGCTGSHFVTTNGLHDDDHYVTARDMAKISKAALENETFRYVACKPNYYIAPTNKDKHGKELWNHHKMVKRTMFNYDGVEGGKTGYTTKAGGTLVTFAKRGDQELIVVDLCAHGYELYEDTIKMLNYGFNNYKTIAPFKTMNTVLKDDTYGFLKTGNELSPYKIPLKHLNDVTVMLEKNQSASKLTYKCKDNKYIISYDGKQIGSVKLH